MYSKAILAVLMAELTLLSFGGRMALAQPEVQGTYEGIIACDTRFSDGTREKLKGEFLIEISQINGNLSILTDDVARFNGVVFADAKKPERKGAGAAILCDINNDPDDQNIMLNFEIKNADKLRAKITGTSAFTFDRGQGQVGHCWFKAKRASTADPDIEFCVEPVAAD